MTILFHFKCKLYFNLVCFLPTYSFIFYEFILKTSRNNIATSSVQFVFKSHPQFSSELNTTLVLMCVRLRVKKTARVISQDPLLRAHLLEAWKQNLGVNLLRTGADQSGGLRSPGRSWHDGGFQHSCSRPVKEMNTASTGYGSQEHHVIFQRRRNRQNRHGLNGCYFTGHILAWASCELTVHLREWFCTSVYHEHKFEH